MNLQFLGATDTVTGSKYLVRSGSHQLLVDCGLFQGWKQLRLRNRDKLPVEPADIEAVILTHAHIDHSGYLPVLVRRGFRGKVYCTPATADLCRILLPDSGHLQEEEAEFANRHGFSKHAQARPLYTKEDAIDCLKQLHTVPLGQAFQPVPGLTARLARSGHMAGSSFVRLDDGARSILFSGDIGRPDDPVLRPPEAMDGADYLVVESTYGDRLHPASNALAALGDVINRTAARGGAVVIPAFAVGRAQSLLHHIHLLKHRKIIHNLPVYLNSPMAASALHVYEKHPGELRLTPSECAALANVAEIVDTPEASRTLNARRGPMVIIAASGMATGGRVVHHIKAFAPHARNTILFAGYQAGGTRGALMVGGATTVRMHGEEVPIRAEIAQLDNLSAHADADEIVQWLRGFKAPPRQTFITHGEPAAADAMRQHIERELGWKCHMPHYLEEVGLG